MYYIYYNTENEIDGAAFFDLTENDVKEMIKPLGQVKKIIRIQKLWKQNCASTEETSICNHFCVYT